MSQFQYLTCLSAPHTSTTISFYDLLGRITNNPNQKEIERLHSLTKECEDYNRIKQNLPCIKPHGTFDGYCSSDKFQSPSGYIYFDIDDPSITKEKLLNEYGNIISVLGHSVGGRGFFLMVRLDKPEVVTVENFIEIQNKVQSTYFADLAIDCKRR